MPTINPYGRIILILCLAVIRLNAESVTESLTRSCQSKYGQVEIGGHDVGLEFHHSRCLPSRISFYRPVANSLDLSRDYWKRDQSQPIKVELTWLNQVIPLQSQSCPYRYTPYQADFYPSIPQGNLTVGYRFAQDIPAFEYRMDLTNSDAVGHPARVELWISALLRTCQTYTDRYPRGWHIIDSAGLAWAAYPYSDTDSAALLILSRSTGWDVKIQPYAIERDTGFHLIMESQLPAQATQTLSLLIGSTRQNTIQIVTESAADLWPSAQHHYTAALEKQIKPGWRFNCPDSSLMLNLAWSRSLMASLKHYLNHQLVPMPCPAEYNFFFSHDLLMTDWGAVITDRQRVKTDLLYLLAQTRSDSILPHAVYWKDGSYQTEFCQSDNWNHLWFLLVTCAYFKHSGDSLTLRQLYPILSKSLSMMLSNRDESGLMCAWRPDWWDIGHIYGARVYLTSMMIKVLREWVNLNLELNHPDPHLTEYLEMANQMQLQLERTFWDPKRNFLMSRLDSLNPDPHYYAGSLMPVLLGQLDTDKSSRMLETAHRELLDPRLGTRIVMPADFHLLTERYQLKDQEVGPPYTYINGGIWTQGIAWHALAYLSIHQPDSCLRFLKDYYTLDGIRNSPQGLPSYFEYRMCNPDHPLYGQIDKPTFLWSGGWFIHTLYNLAGMRINEWNLRFDPVLPSHWSSIDYDILWHGIWRHVDYSGQGCYFKRISIDNQSVHSAVITGPGQNIRLERGIPETPYLAEADCRIEQVTWQSSPPVLKVEVSGLSGQPIRLTVMTPRPLRSLRIDSVFSSSHSTVTMEDSVGRILIQTSLNRNRSSLELNFDDNP